MKRCPICDARVFEDMEVCFGCLYHFKEDKAKVAYEASAEGLRSPLASHQPLTIENKSYHDAVCTEESLSIPQNEFCESLYQEKPTPERVCALSNNQSGEFAQRIKEIETSKGEMSALRVQENKRALGERLERNSRLMSFIQSHPDDISWKDMSLHVERLGSAKDLDELNQAGSSLHSSKLAHARNAAFDLRAQLSCRQASGSMTYIFGETITLWQLYEILGTISSQEDLDLDVRFSSKNTQQNYCVSA